MKKYTCILALTLFSLPIFAKGLTIGTNAFFQPFEYHNENNEIVGFDIDLMNALCEEIKESCQYTQLSFDNLIPRLKTRKVDVIISGIDITEERKKQIAFVGPYYNNSAVFIIPSSSNFQTFNQFDGKKVGVQNGSTHQRYLIEQMPNVTIVNYDNYPNAILDIKNGRIDAVLNDSAASKTMIKDDPSLMIFNETVTDPNYFGQGLGIAMRQQNEVLKTQLEQALATIKSNGVYDKIYQKWFN